MYQVANLTEVELASGNVDSDDTTMALATDEGASLPASSGGYLEGVVWATSYGSPVAAKAAGFAEAVRVTARTGDSCTVVRNIDGAGAVDFSSAGVCKFTVDFLKSGFDHLNASSLELHQGGATVALAAPYNVASNACYPIGNYGQATAVSYAKDILMAVPDFEVAGSIIRGFKMRKNTGGNNLCARIGIYSNTTLGGNYYPGTLLAEVEFSNDNDASPVIHNSDVGTTTIVSSDLPYTFPSSGIYWYAIVLTDGTVGGIAGTIPLSLLVLAGTNGGCRNYLGWIHNSSTDLSPIYGIEHAYTYAALPSSFPTTSPSAICAGQTRTSFPYMTKIYQALS